MGKKEIKVQALCFAGLFVAMCLATTLGVIAYAKGSSEPQFKTVDELLEANRKTREVKEAPADSGTKGQDEEAKSSTYSIDYDIDGELILQSIVRQADKVTNGARANLVTTIKGERVRDELRFNTVTSVSRDRYKNEMPLEFYMNAEENRYHGCRGYWQEDGIQSLWGLDALENVEGATLQVVQRPGIFQYRIVLDGEQSMSVDTFGLVLKTMALQAEFVKSEMWELLFEYFNSSVADIKLEFVFDREANLTGIEFRTNKSVDVLAPETSRQYAESFSFRLKLTRLENAEPIEFEVPNDYGAGHGQLGLHAFDYSEYQGNRKQLETTMGTVVDTHVGTTVEGNTGEEGLSQNAAISGSDAASATGEIDWSKVIGSGTADITPEDEYQPKALNTGYSEAMKKLGSSRMDEIVNIMVSGNTGKMNWETLGTYNGTALKISEANTLDWELFSQDGWVLSYDDKYCTTDENGNRIQPADTNAVSSLTATNSKYPGAKMSISGSIDGTTITSKQTVETEGFDQLTLSIDVDDTGAVPPFDFAGFKLDYSGTELPIWISGGEIQGDQDATGGYWSYFLDRSTFGALFNVDCDTQRVRSVQLILG